MVHCKYNGEYHVKNNIYICSTVVLISVWKGCVGMDVQAAVSNEHLTVLMKVKQVSTLQTIQYKWKVYICGRSMTAVMVFRHGPHLSIRIVI